MIENRNRLYQIHHGVTMKIFSKFLLFAIFLLFATVVSYSQQDTVLPFMDYDLAKPYEIGKITVTGTFNSDANAIIGVTGLKSGSKITVPGPEIQKAIRSLWNLKLLLKSISSMPASMAP